MGLDSFAYLVWGIPVLAYDDEAEPTQFWDQHRYCGDACSGDAYDGADHEGDWREFEGELKVKPYGHYQDPEQRGILTSSRMPSYDGDCWDPTEIGAFDLKREDIAAKVYSKSNDQARAAGLDVNFYTDAAWWLVASYG